MVWPNGVNQRKGVFIYFSLSLSEGRRHDAGVLADSGLLTQLQQRGFDTTGSRRCVYGDPAYPYRVHLQCPYRHARLTVQQEAFKTAMSTVRDSVECLFWNIAKYFKFLDFKENLKLQLSSVGKYYIVCAIFRNAFWFGIFKDLKRF